MEEGLLNEFLKQDDDRKEFYKLVEFVSGKEIDYQLPLLGKCFENEEIEEVLFKLAPELNSTKNCSSESLIIFFNFVKKYIKNPEKINYFLEKTSERLRRFPHTVLQSSVTKLEESKNFFIEKAKEFLSSKDLTTFGSGLLILESFEKDNLEEKINVENLKEIILEKMFQDEDLFLVKDAARYLSRNHPVFLAENAIKIFEAKTDRDVRIFILEGVQKVPEVEGVKEVALELIKEICLTDDDPEVRNMAYVVSENMNFIPDELKDILKSSVDDYNAHKSNCIKFNGNSKALLDDLISTMKTKSHNCHECIAKECY